MTVLRRMAIGLIVALAVGLLAACSDDGPAQQQSADQQQTDQQQGQAAETQQDAQQQQQQRATPAAAAGPLKIAFLADFSGGLSEYGVAMQRGFDLAISQVNAAGGVWGQPVEFVLGDTGLDPTRATEEARRLIEVEGVHAIVGPLASSITLAVVESVAADAGVLVVSPSATSPQLTIADDNDFLFRSSPSDAAQGPILAQLAADQGHARVGVLYRNDAWGQGLADAFGDTWGGDANFVAIEVGRASYVAELQQAAQGGADALVAIAFPPESEVFIREALEQGIFDHFIFTDGNKSQDLIDAIGGDYLNGMQGTAPVAGPETEALRNYRADFAAEIGDGADEPFVAQTYDAAVVIALAAEHAGSDDRSAIRDSLRAVAGPPGDAYPAGADGVAAALAAIRAGGDVDFAGASTSVDFDAAGDITTGFIGVWQYADGTIEEVGVTAFDLSGGPAMVMPAPSDDQDDDHAAVISDEPLKIGFLADYSGAIAEFGPAIQTGVDLAISQLNAAGGILGHNVELVIGDTGLDATQAVEEARRLIEVEGVHAIVGPLASSITLSVVESVAADAGVVVISPSATSPQITIAEDNDFLFRSTTSDAAQGPVLAQLAQDEGFTSVGVLYLNDAYGQGLADAFELAYRGDIALVAIEDGQTSYIAELERSAQFDAQALVAIAFPAQAVVFIREALEQGIYDQFLFVDGTKSQDLIDSIGGEYLDGMRGTAPSPGPGSDSLAAYQAAYEAEYGELSPLPFIAEAYDATIAIGLAAQAAGSVESAAIRDHLREVAGPPGAIINATIHIADALHLLDHGDDINYEGAATTLDWNENGDVTTGFIGIWQFEDGTIVEVGETSFNLGE